MAEPISDETARTLRRLWFDYLDTVEPSRGALHAYCLKLTGSVFDAEDLVQESLLRAFGALGRGDAFRLRTPQSPAAYLARVATNLFIDGERRREIEGRVGSETPVQPEPSSLTRSAGAALFALAAPQERAAVVLKDVFDFSLAEIAAILETTVGAVKTALHRGRGKLAESRRPAPRRGSAASPALIDAFVAAFNARDLVAITALLLEEVVYEARGVGGEVGREAIWIEVNAHRAPGVIWERVRFADEDIAVGTGTGEGGRGGKRLLGISRLEESAGRISRHVGYFYCPETLALVAEALGMQAANWGYHQDPETLERMIGDSALPWRSQ